MIFRKETIPNFFSAMWKVVVGWWKGEDVVAKLAVVDRRLAICERCPEFVKDSRQCEVCTCFVDIKTQLKTAKCPIGRWR